MKVVRTNSHLKIVGKAWQVKAKLKEIAKSSLTVQEYLKRFV